MMKKSKCGVGAHGHTPSQSSRITRRGFLGFFLLGGVISLLGKKVKGVIGIEDEPKKAMFWRKTNESK